ncbi:magnesium transporter [Candidatus Tisiphia endosymbiont of Nedyus quadrimaculatus]|uniref:magnesium transporter n=1 Tax=Candidatus Tisiphia endosymbiont of Nedyus quadrimaculatus TaxID=3139332 RepID=UPI00345EBDD2
MQNQSKNMLSVHQNQFDETFEQINNLLNNDEFGKAIEIMSNLHYADLADVLDNINQKTYKIILPLLQDTLKPETLVQLSVNSKPLIMQILGIQKSVHLINQLAIEDAVEVIEDLDDLTKEMILDNLKAEKRQQIIEGCTYPEDTVGRVIERNFVSFQEDWTVATAIDFIRHKHIAQDFHAAIVLDSKYRPIGSILLSTLLKHKGDKLVKDLMNPEFKITDVFTNLSELSFIFKQYALTIVPVVNKSGKLIGTVSIDSMLYIIEQQTEKDIMSLGGVYTQDTFYNLFYTVRHRFPWLFVNLITACMTSIIINQFSITISKLITLAAIMPIVASMGGNAGTQAMTVTVRALANKDIHHNNVLRVILKEIAVCGFNGSILALVGALLSLAMLSDPNLSLIFSIAVILTFLIAGLFGSVIPITLHYLNIDPATGSGVFLTTITDSFAFFTFLTLAYTFLV